MVLGSAEIPISLVSDNRNGRSPVSQQQSNRDGAKTPSSGSQQDKEARRLSVCEVSGRLSQPEDCQPGEGGAREGVDKV